MAPLGEWASTTPPPPPNHNVNNFLYGLHQHKCTTELIYTYSRHIKVSQKNRDNNEHVFCLNYWVFSNSGLQRNLDLLQKRDSDMNSLNVRKWKTLRCYGNGTDFCLKWIASHSLERKKLTFVVLFMIIKMFCIVFFLTFALVTGQVS